MTALLPLLVEPAALEASLGNEALLIIDLCQTQTWRQLHIPGAVHLNPAELVSGIPPASGSLPELSQLNRLFSRIGYRPDLHIVAYDDEGGGWAARLLWTLDVIGHTRYSLLNGGLHSWYKEQHPVTQEIRQCEVTITNLVLHPEPVAEFDAVLAALKDPGIKIWDARSAEEYAGLRSGSARAGHIPGAVNLDWLELMDREHNLRLLPAEALQNKLEAVGIRNNDHIITHCQSHHRSALSYFVARYLGYAAKGYHGSWGEWGNLPDAPIELMA